MLTRCPACSTHFRVTPAQLKARSGRVRCGACQNVFNALDSLIEVASAQAATDATPRSATESQPDIDLEATPSAEFEQSGGEIAVPPAPDQFPPSRPVEPHSDASREADAIQAEMLGLDPAVPDATSAAEVPKTSPEFEQAIPVETDANESISTAEAGPVSAVESALVESPVGAELTEPLAAEVESVALAAAEAETEIAEPANRESAFLDQAIEPDPPAWSETFPDPPPVARRWPWAIGSLVALSALALQAVLAFRVELVVLWPETRPALVALCDIAECEIGLPARIGLVGIEASDLFPDSTNKGRLALTATLKSRAPFAQQFPHIELTLTDTADKAIARKVLAPEDYLPATASVIKGMPPNADIVIAIGIEPAGITASGYRLYLFYP